MKVCRARINYLKLFVVSIICSRCEAIFSQDVAKEEGNFREYGMYL